MPRVQTSGATQTLETEVLLIKLQSARLAEANEIQGENQRVTH
jgi:hypothetical protein